MDLYRKYVIYMLTQYQSIHTEQILFELQKCECEYSEDGVDYSDFAGCLVEARDHNIWPTLLFTATKHAYLELKGKFCDYLIPDHIREAIFITLVFSLVCRGKLRLSYVLDGRFAKVVDETNPDDPIVEFYQPFSYATTIRSIVNRAHLFRIALGTDCECRALIVW